MSQKQTRAPGTHPPVAYLSPEVWDVFKIEPGKSHRRFPLGTLISGAKAATALGLSPLHRRLLGPQRDFNRQLFEFTQELITGRFSAGVGLQQHVRDSLEEKMRATETRESMAGLGVAASLVEPALELQRKWNRHATELLLRLLEDEGREPDAQLHAAIRQLQRSSNVPRSSDLHPASRLTFPLWVELFRRQEQFNAAITRALSSPYGVPASEDNGSSWYPAEVLDREQSRQQWVAEKLKSVAPRPLISVITPTYAADRRWLLACVFSLQAQSYENWELCLVDDGSPNLETRRMVESIARLDPRIKLRLNPKNQGIALATNDALGLATGEFVAFLDHDDTLAPNALGEAVLHLSQHPETDVLFTDEDRLDEEGRRIYPFFKPGWSPDLLRAVNYLCHFLVVRRSLIEAVGRLRPGFDGAQDYDLVLRLTQRARRVGHVPEVLYHWRATPQSTALDVTHKPKAAANGVRALTEHLESLGERGTVMPTAPTQYHVFYEVPDSVRVQVVVAGASDLRDLRQQLDAVPGPKRELCAVCTGEAAGAQTVHWEGPFDLGAMYERARREVRADVYVFLHEDVEVPPTDWLRELAAQALRPEIGVVGPKIVHPDSMIEGVGWFLDEQGQPLLPFAGVADEPDWTTIGLASWTRNFLAVSPVCFAVRASVLERLGGFRAGLRGPAAVLDLCLRAHDAGLRVLYTPHARITHFGNSARSDERPAGLGAPRQDPYFNPHLSAREPARW